jgi:glutaredoxin
VETTDVKVLLVATKSCTHRPNLERELKKLRIDYRLVFVEDEPDVARKYAIRQSPVLLVNDEVVFRGQPTEREISGYFARLPG